MRTLIVAKYLRISMEDPDKGQNEKRESNSIANQRNLLTDFLRQMPELQRADVREYCEMKIA